MSEGRIDVDKCIWFAGRDEDGMKQYEVTYFDQDIGTFQTYDEAYAALMGRINKEATDGT